MNYEYRGRLVAQMMFSELEKIAQYPAGVEQAQGQPQGQFQERVPEQAAQGESSVIGVIGNEVTKIEDTQAHAFPVIQPPPGYVYAPDLRAFVPNTQDPGWIPKSHAERAQEGQRWYQQGATDSQNMAAQQQQQQQQAQEQQAAQQQAQEVAQQPPQVQPQEQVEYQAQQQQAAQQGQAQEEAQPRQKVAPKRGVTKKGDKSARDVVIKFGQ